MSNKNDRVFLSRARSLPPGDSTSWLSHALPGNRELSTIGEGLSSGLEAGLVFSNDQVVSHKSIVIHL